jgi:hypothetical protein
MNLASWSEGKEILAEYSRLNTLLQVPAYSQTDKEAILAGIDRLGLYRNDNLSLWFCGRIMAVC